MNKEQTLTGVIRGTGACVPKRVMDNDEIAVLLRPVMSGSGSVQVWSGVI